MVKEHYTCDVCSKEMRFHHIGKDYLYKLTKKNYRLYKCENCSLLKIIPTPKRSEIASFYPKVYYSYNITKAKKKGFFLRIREKIIDISYDKSSSKDIFYFLALVSQPFFSGLPLKHAGKRKFLDIGCGDGYNVDLMQSYGWNSIGFEVGKKRKHKNIFYGSDVGNINFQNKFDFIRVWHVLEHVPNPVDFVGHLFQLLSEKGEICIGIPNADSVYAKIFRSYWYHQDSPRHLFLFNPRNLELLLNKKGLEIQSIKYMSTGDFLGSFQNLVYEKTSLRLDLVNNIFLVLLFLPLDTLCNIFKKGDCIAVSIRKSG